MGQKEIKKSLKENQHPGEGFLNLLSGLSHELGAFTEMDKLNAFFLNKLVEIFGVSRISIMQLNDDKEALSLKAALGLDSNSPENITVRMGERFSGWVAKEGKPMLVKDVETEFPELGKERLSRYLTKSFLIIPLKTRDEVRGVLSLTDRKDGRVFNEEDLKLLDLISSYFIICAENIRLFRKNGALINRDPLTSLFNHRYCHEQLLEEIYRAERYRRPLSIIMIDIDNFSDYNLQHGYAAGDNVLKQISLIIQETTRQADIIFRYGPEDFMVILPETKFKEAFLVGERIRDKVEVAIFTEDPNKKSALGMSRLTISGGVVEHQVGVVKEELLRRVSSAVLEAKAKGKNRVCGFR